MQMNSSEEAPNTQKDYLPERDKLFSELFSQFGSQSLETEKPAQAHSPEEEQGLTGLFGNYLSRKGGDGKSSQRKDTSTTDAAADEELILIRTRAAKYWVGVTVLVLLGLFLFLHSIITFLRSPDAIMSISCSLLGTGLCFLAAIIVVKTLRICLQSWSLLRQGRFIAIYLIAFIMAPRFSETFTLLGLVLVGLQVSIAFNNE